jgi:hypothetical protein
MYERTPESVAKSLVPRYRSVSWKIIAHVHLVLSLLAPCFASTLLAVIVILIICLVDKDPRLKKYWFQRRIRQQLKLASESIVETTVIWPVFM